jgi:hypothetical protein
MDPTNALWHTHRVSVLCETSQRQAAALQAGGRTLSHPPHRRTGPTLLLHPHRRLRPAAQEPLMARLQPVERSLRLSARHRVPAHAPLLHVYSGENSTPLSRKHVHESTEGSGESRTVGSLCQGLVQQRRPPRRVPLHPVPPARESQRQGLHHAERGARSCYLERRARPATHVSLPWGGELQPTNTTRTEEAMTRGWIGRTSAALATAGRREPGSVR